MSTTVGLLVAPCPVVADNLSSMTDMGIAPEIRSQVAAVADFALVGEIEYAVQAAERAAAASSSPRGSNEVLPPAADDLFDHGEWPGASTHAELGAVMVPFVQTSQTAIDRLVNSAERALLAVDEARLGNRDLELFLRRWVQTARGAGLVSESLAAEAVEPSLSLAVRGQHQARWGHRVEGLPHTHHWTLRAMVEGALGDQIVVPVHQLNRELADVVHPWEGHYLTHEDGLGDWKGYAPIVWQAEPTVEEIARYLGTALGERVPGLAELEIEEGNEPDRHRFVTLSGFGSDERVMTMSAGIDAKWGVMLRGGFQDPGWKLRAIVGGPADARMIMLADDLEALLQDAVAPLAGRYLTTQEIDSVERRGYRPLLWEQKPTLEALVDHFWGQLEPQIEGLQGLELVAGGTFDRKRSVLLHQDQTGKTLALSATIQERWGLQLGREGPYTDAWAITATVEGSPNEQVMPVDDLESILREVVTPWKGRYLTQRMDALPFEDADPIVWLREPTGEQMVRELWAALRRRLPHLKSLELAGHDTGLVVRLVRNHPLPMLSGAEATGVSAPQTA